jgi:hypothetical protein
MKFNNYVIIHYSLHPVWKITTNWGLTPPAWGDTFVTKIVLSRQSAVSSKIATFKTQDHENKTFTFSISSF